MLATELAEALSSLGAKVAFFGALFAARTDVYAVRYDSQRTDAWLRQKGSSHD